LISAFNRLVEKKYNIDLLLVGPLDKHCGGVDSLNLDKFTNCSGIHYLGYTDCPEQ